MLHDVIAFLTPGATPLRVPKMSFFQIIKELVCDTKVRVVRPEGVETIATHSRDSNKDIHSAQEFLAALPDGLPDCLIANAGHDRAGPPVAQAGRHPDSDHHHYGTW